MTPEEQAERDELKAEIERLKNLDEIGIKEMADMRAVIHRLKADATYHRNKVDELATLTSQLRAERYESWQQERASLTTALATSEQHYKDALEEIKAAQTKREAKE